VSNGLFRVREDVPADIDFGDAMRQTVRRRGGIPCGDISDCRVEDDRVEGVSRVDR
jgi:hypothetical protein